MPLNLAFQLQKVASRIPCLRQSSAVGIPAWLSFTTAMICSSLYRLFFISVFFRRSPIQTEGIQGGNVTPALERRRAVAVPSPLLAPMMTMTLPAIPSVMMISFRVDGEVK